MKQNVCQSTKYQLQINNYGQHRHWLVSPKPQDATRARLNALNLCPFWSWFTISSSVENQNGIRSNDFTRWQQQNCDEDEKPCFRPNSITGMCNCCVHRSIFSQLLNKPVELADNSRNKRQSMLNVSHFRHAFYFWVVLSVDRELPLLFRKGTRRCVKHNFSSPEKIANVRVFLCAHGERYIQHVYVLETLILACKAIALPANECHRHFVVLYKVYFF